MGTETQIVRSDESTGASPPAANSAAESIPACRSAPLISQPLTKDAAGGCMACGRDVKPLHRLKQDEAVRNLCSSCILVHYKGMYCCLCFVAYENSVELSDPALWLTCTKCQRVSHLACARDHNLPTDSMFFTCRDCSKLEKTENGSPPLKKLRLSSDQQISPDEALAAAHIVAFLAVRQARDAKARARALAGVAAGAAARAKAALDTAYRVALEARWKPESLKRFPGVLPAKNRGLPSLSVINAPRISRADGRVSMPNLPHLHSHLRSLSQKDQLGKEPTLLGHSPNARFSAPYNKIKAFPPSTEATKSIPSSVSAFPRSTGFQKPQAGCVQGVEHSPLIESEGAIVSASPASILDAASSLDTPHLNSSTESSSAHVGMPESTGKTSIVLTRSDPPSRASSQLPVSKDQSVNIDNKVAEEVSISAS